MEAHLSPTPHSLTMLHLQPATGNHADAAVDHIHTPNGHMGESDSLQVHPQSPRIHRNHQSFSDSRGFQSEVSTWKTARYHQNSSNLNRSASGALTWSVDSHGNKFGNPNDVGFSLAARRTPGHRESNKESDGIEFHAQMQTEEDPDASSPPLWKTGPPAAPAIKVSSPSHYAQLSPASRSQAIARGRQELMRLVQDMPESSYELSLKDLVETSASGKNFEEASREDERALVHKTIKEDKAIKGKRSCRRRELQSRNMQSGAFLIKMFSPSALGSLRRSSSTGTSSRVSPRPMPVEEKSSDGEWWKIRFSAAGDGERSRINKSIRSSSSGSSSSSRHMDGFISSCWSFLSINKTKGRGHRGCLF